jgi:hypothetical protein
VEPVASWRLASLLSRVSGACFNLGGPSRNLGRRADWHWSPERRAPGRLTAARSDAHELVNAAQAFACSLDDAISGFVIWLFLSASDTAHGAECGKKSAMPRRKRRHFTPEQKADAVRLVRTAGNFAKVARDLDLTETALRSWAQRAEIDEGRDTEGASSSADARDCTGCVVRTAPRRWSASS